MKLKHNSSQKNIWDLILPTAEKQEKNSKKVKSHNNRKSVALSSVFKLNVASLTSDILKQSLGSGSRQLIRPFNKLTKPVAHYKNIFGVVFNSSEAILDTPYNVDRYASTYFSSSVSATSVIDSIITSSAKIDVTNSISKRYDDQVDNETNVSFDDSSRVISNNSSVIMSYKSSLRVPPDLVNVACGSFQVNAYCESSLESCPRNTHFMKPRTVLDLKRKCLTNLKRKIVFCQMLGLKQKTVKMAESGLGTDSCVHDMIWIGNQLLHRSEVPKQVLTLKSSNGYIADREKVR